VHVLDEGPLNPAGNLDMLVHLHGHPRPFMRVRFRDARVEGIVRVAPVSARCEISAEANRGSIIAGVDEVGHISYKLGDGLEPVVTQPKGRWETFHLLTAHTNTHTHTSTACSF